MLKREGIITDVAVVSDSSTDDDDDEESELLVCAPKFVAMCT